MDDTTARAAGTAAAKRAAPTQATHAAHSAQADAGAAQGGAACSFPVAAIAGSAGALDAFKHFLDAMPADSGIALVLLPHLDPTHESHMVALMARHTKMPVVEAVQDMRLQPDRVHVIPPGRYMTLAHGRLHLRGPVSSDPPTSIDLFLRSLAQECAERAACVILSGTGQHGALGVKEIKAVGGLALVQHPDTAEFARMPQSALDTGAVDAALAPDKIPAMMIDFLCHKEVPRPEEDPLDLVGEVIALLRRQLGYEFSAYRRPMLGRRILRRMRVLGVRSGAQYLALLRERIAELHLLAGDLLISVTYFMRDSGAFNALSREVIAPLVRACVPGAQLRVWSIGCATGEEAYSIGMLLLEEMGEHSAQALRVFATDINPAALEVARHGMYPDTIAADLSPRLLERHFVPVANGGFQVSKRLRDIVTFARHDVLSDPPYSRLDLVLCRNLLIYLEPQAQAAVLSRICNGLNESACLMLGAAESAMRGTQQFESVSGKWRIYRRSGGPRPARAQPPPRRSVASRTDTMRRLELPQRPPPQAEHYAQLTRSALLEQFAPAAALITADGGVLYLHGVTDRYLAVREDTPRPTLHDMVREGLGPKLRAAVHEAAQYQGAVILPDAHVRREDRDHPVIVSVRPLRNEQGLLLVTFRDSARSTLQARLPVQGEEVSRVEQLERELCATRDDLQSTIEELETTNEELKTSNEEVMSMNEELQSANEELESSHEELRSLNEELASMNNQMNEKLAELEDAGADMSNLLACSGVCSVFLDAALRVRWFTPAASTVFNLRHGDHGRALEDITPVVPDPDLRGDIERVLAGAPAIERELESPTDHRWWLRRVLPYQRGEQFNDGVVISWFEVTARHLAADNAILHLAGIVDACADAILSKDLDGIIRTWNPGAEQLYGYTAAEMIGRSAGMLVPPERHDEWNRVMALARTGQGVEIETERVGRDRHAIPVALTISPVRGRDAEVTGIVVTARDISERLRAGQALHDREQRLQAILNTAMDAIVIVDNEGRLVDVNPATVSLFGYQAGELIGTRIGTLMPSPDPTQPQGSIGRYLQLAEQRAGGWPELEGRHRSGATFPVEVAVSHIPALALSTVIIRDISRRKELEREVVESVSRLQHRIGHDLHDTVGQELTALNLLTGDLAEVLRTGPAQAPKLLGQMARGLQRVRDELRSVMTGLIPVPVDTEGLMAALEDLTDRTRREAGINCRFECAAPVTVADNFSATHLFLIAQEAVRNAVAHSHARNITVSLSRNGAVRLVVEDDGSGLPASGTERAGLGMRIMRNRARLLGAHIDLERIEPHGTRMQCILSSHDDEHSKADPGSNPDR